jgi:hypothetical protein
LILAHVGHTDIGGAGIRIRAIRIHNAAS